MPSGSSLILPKPAHISTIHVSLGSPCLYYCCVLSPLLPMRLFLCCVLYRLRLIFMFMYLREGLKLDGWDLKRNSRPCA